MATGKGNTKFQIKKKNPVNNNSHDVQEWLQFTNAKAIVVGWLIISLQMQKARYRITVTFYSFL